jgi:hypothetical protein
MYLAGQTIPTTRGTGSARVAERFRNYLDRADPPLSTLDRTGTDRLLDRLRAKHHEPRFDIAPELLRSKPIGVNE